MLLNLELDMSELIGKKYILNGGIIDVEDTSTFEKYATHGNIVYEVIRVEEGLPIFYNDYMNRLENSFDSMKRKLPASLIHIEETVKTLIEINSFRSGPVKLVFGLDNPGFFMTFIMLPHLPKDEEYRLGVKTVLLYENRDNPNVKKWNENLRQKSIRLLKKTGAYEAILVNEHDTITEASRSNIFFTKGETVFTTPDLLILPGITRKKVLEACSRLDMEVKFENINLEDLGSYDSCFLTGTARKIVPVKKIENMEFEVGNSLVQKISNSFENMVMEYIQLNKLNIK